MTKTKRIQILCLLGAVALLLSGCCGVHPSL